MFSKAIAIVAIAGLSTTVFAQSKSVTEKCEDVTVTQFIPLKGEAQAPQVVKTTLLATRTETPDGDKVIYKTEGKYMDEKGQVMSTYTATRKTQKVTLSDSSYREVSDVTQKTMYAADPITPAHEKDASYQIVIDYQRQADGSYLAVKQYQNGSDVTGTDVNQVIEAANGDKYDISWSTTPENYPAADGNMKILSSKQVCITHKN